MPLCASTLFAQLTITAPTVSVTTPAQQKPVSERARESSGDTKPVQQPPLASTVEALLSSLAKQSKPDWAAKFRPPNAAPLAGRVQTAFVLGTFLADSYLAAQAEDAQQCRNAGKEVLALSKTLGVQAELLDRGRSLGESAQRREWLGVRRELEAVILELNEGLKAHQDEGLVNVIALGSWLRGLEIVASVVSENYSDSTAMRLRQPAIALQMEWCVGQLTEPQKRTPFLVQIRPQIMEIQLLLSGPLGEAPSQAEIGSMATTLSSVLNAIYAAPPR
jgi:hypothetical protein